MYGKQEIWHRLIEERYLFSISSSQLITFLCDNGTYTQQIPPLGILKIPTYCKAQTHKHLFFSTASYTTTFSHPILTFNITLPKIHYDIPTDIEPPQLHTINLEEFRSLSDQLRQNQRTIETSYKPIEQIHINYFIIIIQLIIILLIIVYFYKKCSNYRNQQNATNVTLSIPQTENTTENIPLERYPLRSRLCDLTHSE